MKNLTDMEIFTEYLSGKDTLQILNGGFLYQNDNTAKTEADEKDEENNPVSDRGKSAEPKPLIFF